MEIEVIYGDWKQAGKAFIITPRCNEKPCTISPEWLLAYALKHDKIIEDPSKLAYLLKLVNGPYTIHKAAAVSPTEWRQLFWLAQYVSVTPNKKCAKLLPFAPHTSTLSAIGHPQVCIDSTNINTGYLQILIDLLAATGTKKLYLINPSRHIPSRKVFFSGIRGLIAARQLLTPRETLKNLHLSLKYSEDFKEIMDTVSEYISNTVVPDRPIDLLKEIFQEKSEEARGILEELLETGGTMSLKAYLEGANRLYKEGEKIAIKLIYFGYVTLLQTQVNITHKGIFVLKEGY